MPCHTALAHAGLAAQSEAISRPAGGASDRRLRLRAGASGWEPLATDRADAAYPSNPTRQSGPGLGCGVASHRQDVTILVSLHVPAHVRDPRAPRRAAGAPARAVADPPGARPGGRRATGQGQPGLAARVRRSRAGADGGLGRRACRRCPGPLACSTTPRAAPARRQRAARVSCPDGA